MNFKVPQSIMVCGRTVVVVVSHDLAVTTGNMGEALYQPPTITVDANLPPSMVLEVFMHEVLHHIDEIQGGQFGFNGEEYSEQKCKALAIAIAGVLDQL